MIGSISCGVPQGSILGPLLFILYINDISNVSKVLFFLIFADDANVFITGTNIDELMNIMNEELLKPVEWLNINKLSLNVSKTSFMIFRTKHKKRYVLIIFKLTGLTSKTLKQLHF